MRTIPFFSVLLSVALFAGCGGDIEDTYQNEAEKKAITLTGVVEKKELSIFEEGTHYLTTKSEEKYLLKSTMIDLSKSEGILVTISGEISPKKDQMEYPLVSVFTLDKEIPEESERRSLFAEHDHYFSAKLPGSWQREEKEEGVIHYFPENSKPVISAVLLDITKETKAVESAQKDMRTGIHITAGGKPARRVTKSGGEIDIYVSLNTKDLLIFSFLPRENPEEEKLTFYEMISDLEWIDEEEEEVVIEEEGEKIYCGGVAKKLCPSGYRCELASFEENATGVCINANKPPSDISKELSSDVFEAKEEEFEEMDEEVETEEERSDEDEEESETEDFPSEEIEDTEINLTGYTEYKNNPFDYYFSVPKSWWWIHVGAADGNLSQVKLAPEEVTDENVIAYINIVSGSVSEKSESVSGNTITVSVPRTEKSHYEVTGGKEYAEQLRNIASSFKDIEEE